jgi:hypothetical protein
MRWFRRLTGSTYDGKPISEALGGAAAASETGAEGADEGNWLARGYRAVRDFARRHYRVALGAAAGLSVMAAAERGADAGVIIDLNWRLAGDNSNISYLADKDLLDSVVTSVGIFDQPCGPVRFADTDDDVPADWMLIFMDSGNQPVGVVFTRPGYYNTNQALDTAVYGDDPDTPIDEGVTMNTNIWVLAKDPTGIFFKSYFATPFKFTGYETPRLAHVFVTNTQIPEPATLALLGAGAGLSVLMRRRRKGSGMESDIGKPETPYYRRFE